jgi:hypothetical protein
MRMVALLACVACTEPLEPKAPSPPSGSVTVVDEAGRPVAGATIAWAQASPWPCDVTQAPTGAYVWTGAGTTDAESHFSEPHLAWDRAIVRAVAPDGRAVLALARTKTLVVHPVATITIAPNCDGDCGNIDVFGTLTTNGATCEMSANGAHPALVRVPRGTFDLHVRIADGNDNERYTRLRGTVDRDLALTSAAPRVAGPLVVRGRILIDGAPPGGPDYASSVKVRCGEELTRIGKIDATTGAFRVEHLPARACRLEASSDVRDSHFEREVAIDPSAGRELVVDLRAP